MLLRADLNPIDKRFIYKVTSYISTQISKTHKFIFITVLTTNSVPKKNKYRGKYSKEEKKSICKGYLLSSFYHCIAINNNITKLMSLDRTQLHQPSPSLQSWNMVTKKKKNLGNISQRTYTLHLGLDNIQVSPQAENLCH